MQMGESLTGPRIRFTLDELWSAGGSRRAGGGGHPDIRIPAKAGNNLFSHIFQDQYQDCWGWTAIGNIDSLHGSFGDLLHGRQPGMDRIVALVDYVGTFLADRIDQWMRWWSGATGLPRSSQASSFLFLFLFCSYPGSWVHYNICISMDDHLILSATDSRVI